MSLAFKGTGHYIRIKTFFLVNEKVFQQLVYILQSYL